MLSDFKMSLEALRYTKLRSALTIISLAIGVATITTVILIGLSIKTQTNKQLSSDSNKLIITPGHNVSSEDVLTDYFGDGASTLNSKDLQIIQGLPVVKSAAGVIAIPGYLQAGSKSTSQASILGVTPDYLQLSGGKLASGQLLESVDNDKAVILGSDTARQLFGATNPIGQTVSVRGQDLTVVGVLRATPITAIKLKQSLNQVALVSMAVAKSLNDKSSLHSILIDTEVTDKQSEVIQDINSSLLLNHHGEQDFSIITPDDIKNTVQSTISNLLKPYLLMASIPLLLVFISLLNVTLASVAERMREIGIRKSIGATNGQIAFQFMTETFVVGVLGALLGLVISHTVLVILQTRLHVTPVISLQIIFVTFVATIILSVLFTLVPAIYASRRNPIDALRHE